MLSFYPFNLESSLINLHKCLSSLRNWFFHKGLDLNSVSEKTEVTCLGATHRRQYLRSLTSTEVADASVSLSDHIKLFGNAFHNPYKHQVNYPHLISIEASMPGIIFHLILNY